MTKAELAAQNVLNYCGIDDPSGIDISKIILGRGAFYYEKPLKGKEGQIISVDGRSIITINSSIEFEPKKRFTTAHELGHYELHKDQAIISDTESDLINWFQGNNSTLEIEANEFAAELLMPTEIFKRECHRKRFGPNLIDYLAKRFKVSKTVAILKFIKSGNHPIMVVFCKDNQMKWFKKSDDFKHFLEFERDKQPPNESVAFELFTTNKIYSGDELKQDVWKSDWFKMRKDETEDVGFYEYCLYVKSYNYTLSVIWED